MVDRRAFLAGVGSASAALAGCADAFGDDSERRVPADWTPAPGEWGGPAYDQADSGHNPHATPPADEPTVAWDVEGQQPSVLVADGTVFLRRGGRLRGLDAEDGTERFAVSRLNGSLLRYVDGRLYDRTVDGVEALTLEGDAEWEAPIDREEPVFSLVEREGYVYVVTASETVVPEGSGAVGRHDAATGERLEDARLDAEVGGLANHEGTLYAALEDGIAALDVGADGGLETRWRHRADWSAVGLGSVAAAGDRAYVRAEPDPVAETVLSAYDLDAEAHLGTLRFDRVVTAPAVGEYVHVVTADHGNGRPEDGDVRAYDGADEQWTVEFDSVPAWSALADGTLYVGSGLEETRLTALDAATGEERWTYEGAFPHAVVGETVYASTDDGRFVALRE